MTMTVCPTCGQEIPEATRGPTPSPSPACAAPAWLRAAAADAGRGDRPVPLQGTARQVAWAESLRRVRLAYLRTRGDRDTMAALAIIRDSTWWIAHVGVPLAELKWPAPDQVEMPRVPMEALNHA